MILHKHHIVPRYAGGTNKPENITLLTVEEHAEAHRLLWEKNGDRRDYLAWGMLSKRIGKEELVREWSSMGGRALKGRPRSEETKKKISASHMGLTNSEETRKKISDANRGNKYQLGMKKTKETREKLRIAHLGITQSEESKAKRSVSMKEVWKRRKMVIG
jgi:hypothetical protein